MFKLLTKLTVNFFMHFETEILKCTLTIFLEIKFSFFCMQNLTSFVNHSKNILF